MIQTKAQRIALTYPCRFGFETAHRRYGTVVGPTVSLVLTINNGYE